MSFVKIGKILSFLMISSIFLSACNGKFPGADARKFPADPKERVKKNLEEGRGFTLNKAFGNATRGGTFDFASSNELWRASLDVIDFMPLSSVNYSGGIIITDWYSDGNSSNESIKISIRFLTNEIRSDALKVKIFTKICNGESDCKIKESNNNLAIEITKKILKTAALYKEESKAKEKEKK
mgnify:CR=1 FL=1